MAADASSGLLTVRPSFTRSRSNTSPPPSRSNLSDTTSAAATPRRPGHFRSRSYISPTEDRLTDGSSAAPGSGVEKSPEFSRFPRLHFPGRHHHRSQNAGEDVKGTNPRRSHKYTQSDVQQYHRKNDPSRAQAISPDMAVPYIDLPTDSSYPSSRGTAIPSLMRMKSSHHPRTTATQDRQEPKLRRANSDPRSPASPELSARLAAPIEPHNGRVGLSRFHDYRNATRSDVDRLTKQIQDAKHELSTRVGITTRTASTLIHRLSDTHNALHRTTESLTDTLSSFSNLAQQSSQLLANFDAETTNLDSSIRKRIHDLHASVCDKRGERVMELEVRGREMSAKAEDLGRRLNNCRTIVQNWEKRESNKRRAWQGVRNGVLWALMLTLIAILTGVVSWNAVHINSGNGTAKYALQQLVAENETWQHGRGLEGASVPDDVRMILDDIAERSQFKKSSSTINDTSRAPTLDSSTTEVPVPDDKRMRLLDEL